MPTFLNSQSKLLNPMIIINKKVVKSAKKKFSQNPVSATAESIDGAKLYEELSAMFERVLNSFLELSNLPLLRRQQQKKTVITQMASTLLINILNQLQAINKTVISTQVLSIMTALQQKTLASLFQEIQTYFNTTQQIVQNFLYTNYQAENEDSGEFKVYFAKIEEILLRLSLMFNTQAQFQQGGDLNAPQQLDSFPFTYVPLGYRPQEAPEREAEPEQAPEPAQAQAQVPEQRTPEHVTLRRRPQPRHSMRTEELEARMRIQQERKQNREARLKDFS
jgi:hypothetical protein